MGFHTQTPGRYSVSDEKLFSVITRCEPLRRNVHIVNFCVGIERGNTCVLLSDDQIRAIQIKHICEISTALSEIRHKFHIEFIISGKQRNRTVGKTRQSDILILRGNTPPQFLLFPFWSCWPVQVEDGRIGFLPNWSFHWSFLPGPF